MVADFGKIEIDGRTGVLDFTAIHNVDIVSYFMTEVEELLDKQDGRALFVPKELQCATDVLDDRGLNAFSGFIKDENFGTGQQRPSNSQLLLAARQTPTSTQHGLQHRKQLKI